MPPKEQSAKIQGQAFPRPISRNLSS